MKCQVLYVGSLCSQNLIAKILDTSNNKPNLAGQKFHRLFAEGMAMQPDLFDVSTVSVPPVVSKINNHIFFTNKSENENNIYYSYIPILLIPGLRNIFTALFVFSKIIIWSFSGIKKNKIIIFDILNIGVSTITILATMLCKVKTVVIVTDLPEMMFVLKERPNLINKLTSKFQNFLLKIPQGYIFLTEAMNKRINLKQKPYLIMEGLVDIRMSDVPVPAKSETTVKTILYSGGLYEKFGIKTLLDGFILIEGENYNLYLYGVGNMNELIEDYTQKDSRIKFFGYVPNQAVVEAQLKATLLVNPRFTNEEYTKYSFPSKNMEYMASGTPLVTTRLQGMPDEYEEYVYIFKEETVEGFKETLAAILAKPASELYAFGVKAKEFVSKKKNNKVQAERFYMFVNSSF
jgi:glycosyltransferase involved in cell wall biosynthesis